MTQVGLQTIIDNFARERVFEPLKGGEVDEIASPMLRSKVQEVDLTTRDGIKLSAWYVPAQPGKPTVVYAHGNKGNKARDFRQRTMERFVNQGFGYLTFDYRGYGKSEGTPSEKGLYEDYRAAVRYLRNRHNLQPERDLIALGESLGGAVVVDAATEIPFRAVMIFATFTTMSEMVQRMQQRYRIPSFIRMGDQIHQQFRSIDKISRVRSPLLIAHGEKDTFIPPDMAKAMYAAAKASLHKAPLHLVQNGQHNDLFDLGGPELLKALDHLLADTQYMAASIAQPKTGRKHRLWFPSAADQKPAPVSFEPHRAKVKK